MPLPGTYDPTTNRRPLGTTIDKSQQEQPKSYASQVSSSSHNASKSRSQAESYPTLPNLCNNKSGTHFESNRVLDKSEKDESSITEKKNASLISISHKDLGKAISTRCKEKPKQSSYLVEEPLKITDPSKNKLFPLTQFSLGKQNEGAQSSLGSNWSGNLREKDGWEDDVPWREKFNYDDSDFPPLG